MGLLHQSCLKILAAGETTSAAASMNTTSMPIPDAVGLNQAGTWSRAGDVLTLDPVGSSVTVLKRK